MHFCFYQISWGQEKKAKFADKIKAHIEQVQMGTDEVLRRLAEQARAEYSKYLKTDGTFDLQQLIADDKAHLIKKMKRDSNEYLEIEFYDAHAALVDIGKHLGLFKFELTGKDGGPIPIRVVGGVNLDDIWDS